MNIQPISNVNFERKRYVKPKQLASIREITEKMNNAGTYIEKGLAFESDVIGALKKDNVMFFSSLTYRLPNVSKKTLNIMTTELSIGKNKISINNAGGEITSIKKCLFMPTKKLMNKMDKYLQIFNEKFNDDNIVEKRHLRSCGATLEGANRISEAIARLSGEN